MLNPVRKHDYSMNMHMDMISGAARHWGNIVEHSMIGSEYM
jgi:hypothetical protein